jgi:hypothetical protein
VDAGPPPTSTQRVGAQPAAPLPFRLLTRSPIPLLYVWEATPWPTVLGLLFPGPGCSEGVPREHGGSSRGRDLQSRPAPVAPPCGRPLHGRRTTSNQPPPLRLLTCSPIPLLYPWEVTPWPTAPRVPRRRPFLRVHNSPGGDAIRVHALRVGLRRGRRFTRKTCRAVRLIEESRSVVRVHRTVPVKKSTACSRQPTPPRAPGTPAAPASGSPAARRERPATSYTHPYVSQWANIL